MANLEKSKQFSIVIFIYIFLIEMVWYILFNRHIYRKCFEIVQS